MAGILIYTAASDSEGTLGGLVLLGQPVTLSRRIQQALESMRICVNRDAAWILSEAFGKHTSTSSEESIRLQCFRRSQFMK